MALAGYGIFIPYQFQHTDWKVGGVSDVLISKIFDSSLGEFWRPGITWSHLQKNWSVKTKKKVNYCG